MFKGLLKNKKKGPLSNTTKDNIFVLKKPFIETDPTVPQHVKDIKIQDIEDWFTAFNETPISGSITGDKDKTVTITKRDGSILQFSFTDNEGVYSDDVINTATFDEATGVWTFVTSEGYTITENMDGRYSLLGHTHDFDKYVRWGFKITGGAVEYINSQDILEFEAGDNMNITRTGKKLRFSSTASGVSFVQGTLTRTASFSLDASMNQKTIILNLTSDITITITSGLGTDFACNIVSEDSGIYYASLVQGSGTTLKAPHGKKLLTDYTCNIIKKTGQEVFNAQGELTV